MYKWYQVAHRYVVIAKIRGSSSPPVISEKGDTVGWRIDAMHGDPVITKGVTLHGMCSYNIIPVFGIRLSPPGVPPCTLYLVP